MEGWVQSAIIGGIVGGIVGGLSTLIRSKKAAKQPCPDCGKVLGSSKPGPPTPAQKRHGGWTCPHCGCDVDRNGTKRTS